MRLHNKQFILCCQPILIYDDWQVIPVSETLFLSCCPHAHITVSLNKTGINCIIIGQPTLPHEPDSNPAAIIEQTPHEEMVAATSHWGGRWVLITHDRIITDASTLLGVFYNIEKKIISSSPALIHQFIGGSSALNGALSNRYYYNWFLAPGTAFKGVTKLLVSQQIHLQGDCIIIMKKNLVMDELKQIPYTDVYRQLSELMKNEMLYISKSYRINTALSSGYDSRLIYSIAKAVLSDKFRSYTHIFPSMTGSDYHLPRKISNVHIDIRRKKYSLQKLQHIDQQNALHVLDADRIFYAYGQWDGFTEKDACIRGSILELAGKSSAHLYNEVPELTGSLFDSKIMLYSLGDFRGFQLDSLNQYFNWSYYQHPLAIDSKKRFYWEQRVGGWLSYIEQSIDILPCSSFQIANSLYCINLFLNIPPAMMKIKSFHIDFIREHTASVLEFPFNTYSRQERIEQIARSTYYKLLDKVLNHRIAP